MAATLWILLALATLTFAQVNLLWPRPQKLDSDVNQLNVDPSLFSFKATCAPSSILNAAFARYSALMFNKNSCSKSQVASQAPSDASLVSLNVCVSSTIDDLQVGVDESYTLNIAGPNATLSALTVFGALHGIETFSQLLVCSSSTPTQYFVGNTPIVISDAPRFPWRGLLIDTSRHFLPISTILRAVDALSFVKMNTLHWHAVDAQVCQFSTPSSC
jgi:hexosaminidase